MEQKKPVALIRLCHSRVHHFDTAAGFCLLTSAALRREEIVTVQIESASVLVFVVTKQKRNEVFVLYGGMGGGREFLAALDGQPLGVSETEPAAGSCHPQKQEAWQGTRSGFSGSSPESDSAGQTPELPPMGGSCSSGPLSMQSVLLTVCVNVCVCVCQEPRRHTASLNTSRTY